MASFPASGGDIMHNDPSGGFPQFFIADLDANITGPLDLSAFADAQLINIDGTPLANGDPVLVCVVVADSSGAGSQVGSWGFFTNPDATGPDPRQMSGSTAGMTRDAVVRMTVFTYNDTAPNAFLHLDTLGSGDSSTHVVIGMWPIILDADEALADAASSQAGFYADTVSLSDNGITAVPVQNTGVGADTECELHADDAALGEWTAASVLVAIEDLPAVTRDMNNHSSVVMNNATDLSLRATKTDGFSPDLSIRLHPGLLSGLSAAGVADFGRTDFTGTAGAGTCVAEVNGLEQLWFLIEAAAPPSTGTEGGRFVAPRARRRVDVRELPVQIHTGMLGLPGLTEKRGR